MIDNYSHDDPNVMYVTENIPGPVEDSLEYSTLMVSYNSQMLYSCICREECVNMLCKCLQVSKGFKHNVKLKQYYPVIECNSNCACIDCSNRIVQKGPIEGLIVKSCQNKGLGLFTTLPINRGMFVCEYAGELLTKSQALARSKENDDNNTMNYVFCLNEHTNEVVIQTFVDPSKFGNIGRYINHSCDPNCIVVPVRYENAIPHLAIFALNDIYEDTEITFSYGESDQQVLEESKTVKKQKPCFCHTEKCKGFMPFDIF